MKRSLPWVVLLLALSLPALAETRRMAVVIGNNAGSGNRPPLHYAESDAGKVASVLVDVGEVAPKDLFLFQGRRAAEVEAAIEKVGQEVSASHQLPDARVVLLFFFSGHSDGQALEVGADRLTFERLRQLLLGTRADVRLLIVDACKSGAAILDKGGQPAPPFSIRLTDELNTTGEVTLASSAASELALESEEVRGSFFTHHLVSGLRGAADVSGDGRVTLGEAYRYAYDRTVSSSTATLEGPHHPVYDLRLSGQGELVLAFLDRLSSAVRLPTPFDRALLIQLVRDQVVAELTPAAARTVALPPGNYGVRVVRDGQTYGTRFTLGEKEIRVLSWDDLPPLAAFPVVSNKGSAPAVPTTVPTAVPQRTTVATRSTVAVSRGLLTVAGGLGPGVAKQISVGGAIRVGLQKAWPTGVNFALHSSLGGNADHAVYEPSVQLRAGYSFGAQPGRLGVALGLEAGPGFLWQTVAGDETGATFLFILGPRLALHFQLARSVAISLEMEAMLGLLEIDQSARLRIFPSAFLGVAFAL